MLSYGSVCVFFGLENLEGESRWEQRRKRCRWSVEAERRAVWGVVIRWAPVVCIVNAATYIAWTPFVCWSEGQEFRSVACREGVEEICWAHWETDSEPGSRSVSRWSKLSARTAQNSSPKPRSDCQTIRSVYETETPLGTDRDEGSLVRCGRSLRLQLWSKGGGRTSKERPPNFAWYWACWEAEC